MRFFLKRLFDIAIAGTGFLVLAVPMSMIAILVKATSQGNILYWSDRVGKNNVIFKMPKFRSMRIDTPAVATHLLANPACLI
jgi:O-antigen biosynthesis protein WbqP